MTDLLALAIAIAGFSTAGGLVLLCDYLARPRS
jgi:hypothetical protein